MVPTGIIGYLFLLVQSTTFICKDMKAPFLLDKGVRGRTELLVQIFLRFAPPEKCSLVGSES